LEDFKKNKEIILECIEKTKDFSEILKEDYIKEKLKVVDVLNKIFNEEKITDIEIENIETIFGYSIKKIFNKLKSLNETKKEFLEDELHIKFTSFEGSKGLSADYVFIVGVNQTKGTLKGFPADIKNPTDNEICKFLVGLTRTRKKCYLISNQRFSKFAGIRESSFISWIKPERLKKIKVNKDYFNKK